MRPSKVNVRKVKRGNSPSYIIDYWLDGVRHRPVVSKNKRQAEIIAAKKELELSGLKHNLIPEVKEIKSVDELIDEFLQSKKHEVGSSTLKRYKNHLEPLRQFLNNLFPQVAENISLFKSLYFVDLIDYVKENYSWEPVTINRMREMVSSLFTFAIDREYLIKNPIKGTKNIPIPEKGKPKYFSKPELKEIWNNVDPFWRPFLRFIYHTGLRKGELINLTWKNVELEKKISTIKIISIDEWTTKTRRYRILPLNENALTIIKNQIGVHNKYVFVSKKGEKIHPNSPYIALKKTLNELGLTGDVHKLRHTHASQLANDGRDIYAIQKLLGHTKIETTQIYAHLSTDYQHSVVEALEDDFDD